MSPIKTFNNKTNDKNPARSLPAAQRTPPSCSRQMSTSPLLGETMSYAWHSEAAAATCGSAGLCRAGCTDSELPLEKDSDREGTGGSSPLPVCLAWASGELWLVFLNLSSTCIRELEDMAPC